MHLLYLLAAVVLTAYVASRVAWFALVARLDARYGLHMQNFSLSAVSSISFSPKKLNPNAPLALDRVRIDRLALSFHRPTLESSSWLTLTVVRAVLFLSLRAVDSETPRDPLPRDPPSSASAHQADLAPRNHPRQKRRELHADLQRFLDSNLAVLRNGLVRVVLRWIDVKLEDLEVVVCGPGRDGSEVLRYTQESLSLSFRAVHDILPSSAIPPSAPTLGSESCAPVLAPNFCITLTVSPFVIVAPGRHAVTGNAKTVTLLSAQEISTVSLSAHASTIFNRVSRPSVVANLSGICVSSSGLLDFVDRLKTNCNACRGADPPPPQVHVERHISVVERVRRRMNSRGPSMTNMDRPIYPVSPLSSAAHDLASEIRSTLFFLGGMKPTVTLNLSRSAVTHTLSDACVLATLDFLSLSVGIVDRQSVNAITEPHLDASLILRTLSVELIDLSPAAAAARERPTSQLFSFDEFVLKADVPCAENDELRWRRHERPPVDVSVTLTLLQPQLTCCDRTAQCLARFVAEKRAAEVTAGDAHPSVDPPTDASAPPSSAEPVDRALLSSFLVQYRPAIEAQIVGPTVLLRMQSYHSTCGVDEEAVLAARIEEIAAFAYVSRPQDAYDDGGGRPGTSRASPHRHSPEHPTPPDVPLICKVRADIELKTLALDAFPLPRGAPIDSCGLPPARDRLLDLDSLTIGAALAVPADDAVGLDVEVHIAVGCMLLDLSRLSLSKDMDYFAATMALSILIEKVRSAVPRGGRSRVVREPTAVMDARAHTVAIDAVTDQIRVVVIGEDKISGKVLDVISLHATHTSSPERGAHSPSTNELRIVVEGITLRTIGEFLEGSVEDSRHVEPICSIARVEFPNPEKANLNATGHKTVGIRGIKLFVCLRVLYVSVLSSLYVVKLSMLLARSSGVDPHQPPTPATTHPLHPSLVITLTSIALDIELPDEVRLQGTVGPITIKLKPEPTMPVRVHVSNLFADVELSPGSRDYRRLLTVTALDASVHTPPPSATQHAPTIDVAIEDLSLTVPHAFAMASVIESAVNMIKATKNLVLDELGLQPGPHGGMGNTVYDAGAIPVISLAVGTVA
ncbi:hypothetical protein BDK51DRAFT_39490, partial [Blyttiomyces helicus]